jgi:hypothetical protein
MWFQPDKIDEKTFEHKLVAEASQRIGYAHPFEMHWAAVWCCVVAVTLPRYWCPAGAGSESRGPFCGTSRRKTRRHSAVLDCNAVENPNGQ